MTDKEIRMILGVMKVAYPNSFRDMQEADRNALVMLWKRQFEGFDYKAVSMAVDSIIATDPSGFMPTIGRVKQEVTNLTQPKMLTEQEAWLLVEKACRNSNYGAREEFDKLPPEIQRFVGSPNQLREWGMMNSDELKTVVASNFMRSYRVRAKNDRDYFALPESVRLMLNEATGGGVLMLE